jgi:predicted transposase/invertase (TIGR01784 family)
LLNHSKEYTEEYIEKLYKEGVMPRAIHEGLERMNLGKWDPSLLQDYNREISEYQELFAPQIAMDMNTAREEGEKKGRMEEKREAAKNFLSAGVDVSIIANSLGLSPDEIKSLKPR